MRKLKLQIHMSLDGFVCGPNGEEDWVVRGDPQGWQLVNELADNSDTLLIGRKMASTFMAHFESIPPASPIYAFAQKMVNMRKLIFTKTLQEPIGQNTTLAKGELAEEIARLKNEDGKDILVYGGASFVSSLVAGGHIDEMYLLVSPVLINKGKRIFDLLDHRTHLTCLEAYAVKSGVTILHYAVKREPGKAIV